MKSYYLLIIVVFIFLGLFALAQKDETLPCIQVITPAISPEGICTNFPTPCDVPEGWKKVDECPEESLPFPIPELGDCASQSECKAYCELPENMAACLDFAEVHNLMPKKEIELARKMLSLGETAGPGGCKGKVECEAYCDEISHIEECLSFAEKHNLIPVEELEEGRKVAKAIKQGIKPPNCKNKKECDIYCYQPENMAECIAFGEAAGLIPPEELEEAKKVLEAVKKGAKPPPCRGKTECDTYCAVPEHLEECITFAEAAGFISSEEAVMVRKTGGKGPGDCQGKDDCEKYCDDPAHAKECINFAVEYGFLSPEEAENAKKMLAAGFTAGPGNCKGKVECEAYCDDFAHMVECVDFAEKTGFIKPEDASRVRKMAEMGIVGSPGGCKGEEECRAFCENPVNAEECLNFAIKIGEISPEEAEKARQGLEMMQKGGPGGCKTEAECKTYCEDPLHAQECLNFAVQQGFMKPEEAQGMLERIQMGPPPGIEMPSEGMPLLEGGSPSQIPQGMPSQAPQGMPIGPSELPIGGPGGCKTPEECSSYCQDPSHMSECLNFLGPEGMMPPQEGLEMITPQETAPSLTPSPTESLPPQSFFEQIKKFLANVAAIFSF